MPLFRRKGTLYRLPYGGGRRSSFKRGSKTTKRRRVSTKMRPVRRFKAKTTGKSSRRRAITSFRKSLGRRGFGRRVRRGPAAGRLLQLFKKRNGAFGRAHPVDRYISTYPTNAFTVDPDLSNYLYMAGWGWGNDVAQMLVNIRAESPFTLTGGANLYQPTLHVYGYTTIDIVPVGNVGINIELITCTPQRGRTGAATLASTTTQYGLSWAVSYDARPTGFEFFPDTSILENTAFFDSRDIKWIPTGRISTTIKVGTPKRFIFKYKTRVFRYAEYAQGTFLTGNIVLGTQNQPSSQKDNAVASPIFTSSRPAASEGKYAAPSQP